MGCSLETYRSKVGLFVSTLHKILTRYARTAATRVRGLRIHSFSALLSVSSLLLMLLIGCVEPNPGPPPSPPSSRRPQTTTATSTINDSNSSNRMNSTQGNGEVATAQLLQNVCKSVQSLTGVVSRLEEGQQQLSGSLNQKLSDIQTTLNDRLQKLGDEQEVLRLDLDELCRKQERVEDDTTALKETVQQLTTTTKWLDNERRKHNLLFFGVDKRLGASCEQLISRVLREQLHMTADVLIEYAYWSGDAILVRFQSLKQRGLVLAQARRLTPDSRLSIREDFSKAVNGRRKGLVDMYKQLRKDNKWAVLRADKLHTDDGVFTYDVEKQQIIQVAPPQRRQRSIDPPGARRSGGATSNAHSATNRNRSSEVMDFTAAADDTVSGTGGGIDRPLAPGNQHRPTQIDDRCSSPPPGRPQRVGPPNDKRPRHTWHSSFNLQLSGQRNAATTGDTHTPPSSSASTFIQTNTHATGASVASAPPTSDVFISNAGVVSASSTPNLFVSGDSVVSAPSSLNVLPKNMY